MYADHIEFALKNPQAADRLLDDTEREIMSLATMPERYALVDDPLLAAWGIRFVQIKNYLAFYMVSKETQTVVPSICTGSNTATGDMVDTAQDHSI